MALVWTPVWHCCGLLCGIVVDSCMALLWTPMWHCCILLYGIAAATWWHCCGHMCGIAIPFTTLWNERIHFRGIRTSALKTTVLSARQASQSPRMSVQWFTSGPPHLICKSVFLCSPLFPFNASIVINGVVTFFR